MSTTRRPAPAGREGEAARLPPEPWRVSRMVPEVEAVITGGRLVSDRLDRPLGIMRPAVAALLLAAPALLEALEAQEAIILHLLACPECGEGPPCEAGTPLLETADALRVSALDAARGETE